MYHICLFIAPCYDDKALYIVLSILSHPKRDDVKYRKTTVEIKYRIDIFKWRYKKKIWIYFSLFHGGYSFFYHFPTELGWHRVAYRHFLFKSYFRYFRSVSSQNSKFVTSPMMIFFSLCAIYRYVHPPINYRVRAFLYFVNTTDTSQLMEID